MPCVVRFRAQRVLVRDYANEGPLAKDLVIYLPSIDKTVRVARRIALTTLVATIGT